MPGGGTAPLMTQAGIAGLLEMVGGGLLLVGLFTRPVAFLLSGEMAFAYFIGHAGKGFWPMLNGGAEAVTFASCGSTSPRPAAARGASTRR